MCVDAVHDHLTIEHIELPVLIESAGHWSQGARFRCDKYRTVPLILSAREHHCAKCGTQGISKASHDRGIAEAAIARAHLRGA